MMSAVRDMSPAMSRSVAANAGREEHGSRVGLECVGRRRRDGGGGAPALARSSVMDVFLALPDAMRVLPGHTDEATIGRERAHNPFVKVWSGAEPEGAERVEVGGRPATLLVWSPDYDGKGKAWVRFEDGSEAIVGGSRVSK